MDHTKIAVIVFHPKGGVTIKNFVRKEALPPTFGLNGCQPVSLFEFDSVSKQNRFYLEKGFSGDEGSLREHHPPVPVPHTEPVKESGLQ